MRVCRRGWVGALLIVVAVVGYDIPAVRQQDGQTISEWWGSLPLWRRLALWVPLTLHLHSELAPRCIHRLDPIAAMAHLIEALPRRSSP